MRDAPGEPAIDQDELEREEKTGADSGGERAIAAKKRNARARSEKEQNRRHDRAQRRLHDVRNIRRDPLDRHLLEAPERGQKQHDRNRCCVERAPLLTHRVDFGVTCF